MKIDFLTWMRICNNLHPAAKCDIKYALFNITWFLNGFENNKEFNQVELDFLLQSVWREKTSKCSLRINIKSSMELIYKPESKPERLTFR